SPRTSPWPAPIRRRAGTRGPAACATASSPTAADLTRPALLLHRPALPRPALLCSARHLRSRAPTSCRWRDLNSPGRLSQRDRKEVRRLGAWAGRWVGESGEAAG